MNANYIVREVKAIRRCINAYKTTDKPLTLEYICKVNEYVSRNESLEWGVLRKGTVGVGDFNITLNNWYLKNELQPLKDCLKCIKTLEI